MLAPTIDYAKYLKPVATTKDIAPTQALREKYHVSEFELPTIASMLSLAVQIILM